MRNYEFNAEFKNHEIGKQNIYRLHYINYQRDYNAKIRITDCPFQPFMLPNNMTREDFFKVLSYLTDFIEKELNLEPCSYQSVSMLDSSLNLERLGFN